MIGRHPAKVASMSPPPLRRRLVGCGLRRLLVAALSCTAISACSSKSDSTLVAFLIADGRSDRWTGTDKPVFEEYVQSVCPDCEYTVQDAEGDADRQEDQLAEVLEDGADVVVLNASSPRTGRKLVAAAGKVPVIAYDEFAPGADYYVSYDASAGGRELAEAVAAELDERGQIAVLNGAQGDPAAVASKRATRRVLRGTRIKVAVTGNPESWSSDEAADWVRTTLSKYPAASLDAIVASSDSQAGGIVAALRKAKISRTDWPLIGGQDADIDALRRIVAGEQSLTVSKSFDKAAQRAAKMAVQLATRREVEEPLRKIRGVPAVVFSPIVVSIDNLTNVIVRGQTFDLEEICAEPVTSRCERLGLR
jgi:D-xylose transport system substrate-binding protein